MKILGREPVAVFSTVEAVVALLLLWLNVDQSVIGYVMAALMAVFGVWGAWATYDTMLTALVGVFKALGTLLVVFGFHLSDAQTSGAIVAITALLGLVYNRSATTPDPHPSLAIPSGPVVIGEVVPTGGAHAAQPYDGDVA